MGQTTTTVRHDLHAAEARLVANGIDSPTLDARVLLRHLLQFSPAELMLHLDDAMRPEQSSALSRLIERRVAGEPVAHLTGRREFYGLDLKVSPDVLIPRPETELLVERAIKALPVGALAVDVGTGSGAIAIAVARHRPDVRLLAVDRSPAACGIAMGNVLEQRVQHAVGVACAGLLSSVRWPVEGVLANLPYLRHDELRTLAAEVRREPGLALDGGADGLDLYRSLFADLALRRPFPALVLCEIAPSQSEAMRSLVTVALPDHSLQVLPDLAGRARLVEASLFAPRS